MPELPTIYLARHGETEWSKAGRHTGRTDLPLTAEGEAHARQLGTRLSTYSFDHVLTSPLERARQTCVLAGFSGELEPALMEWHYGDYEGLTSAQIRQQRPGWTVFADGAPGGESVAQAIARVDGVVNRLRSFTGNVLVVAHGHILRTLAARWIGEPPALASKLLLATATLSVLSFNHDHPDEPAIKQWNA